MNAPADAADAPEHDNTNTLGQLGHGQLRVLQGSVLVVALCGIAYELIIGAVSSYLQGNSVYQFSITIGLFMFAMGLGSFLSKFMGSRLVERFIWIELGVALVGGISSPLLFLIFPYAAFYYLTMYTLIIAVGTMVGLEIPILTRIVAVQGGLRESLANVLALDYVGALIGSVAFPLVLLPRLGLFRSSFAVALLNVAVALIGVIVFRHAIRRPRLLLVLTLLTGVALTAATLAASRIAGFAEGQLYRQTIVYREQTPYQRIIVTQNDLSHKIRLYLDGHLQFAQEDEWRYHESLVLPVMGIAGNTQDILILGGGDGMAVREVLRYPDVQRIDLVDIDPAMTRISRELPAIVALNEGALESDKLTLYHEDAFNFVRETDHRYDRVIIDLPDPHNEVLSKLYSREFYKLVAQILKPGGVLVTQSASAFYTHEVFWIIHATLEDAGFTVHPYHIHVPTFGDWGFNLASIDVDPAGPFDLPADARFLNQDILAAAASFGNDTSEPAPQDVRINSLFEPIIYDIYAKSLNR